MQTDPGGAEADEIRRQLQILTQRIRSAQTPPTALFIAFMALVFWAYSKRRKADFDELARMPLEDDPPARNPGSKTP